MSARQGSHIGYYSRRENNTEAQRFSFDSQSLLISAHHAPSLQTARRPEVPLPWSANRPGFAVTESVAPWLRASRNLDRRAFTGAFKFLFATRPVAKVNATPSGRIDH